MTPTISESRSRQAWELARRQHGVLTRQNLLALGFSAEAIKHRVRTGRLHPIVRGVYAVGRRHLNREGRWMAAVLACGPAAALSHRSAAALWGFGKEHPDYIDLTLRRPSESRLPGLRCHRGPSLPASAITTRSGIPLTQPVQTFLDLATVSGPRTLERAINEADKHDVIDPDALRKALDAHPGEPGVRPLRAILDKHTFRLSDDFFWPSLDLVVETDGWRYHRTPAAQTRDALRFQEHTAAGLTPLRFSHWQVKHEPRHVETILRRTAANLPANGCSS